MKDTVILALLIALLLLVLWPGVGLVSRWRASRRLAMRTRREDALKHILKAEVNGRPSSVVSVAGALRIGENQAAELLAELERRSLLTFEKGAPRLRRSGRELARHVIRAHRLWESFLADQTGVGEEDWHREAERKEHLLSPEETNLLSAKLGHPVRDPHGDSIPEAGEEVAADAGLLLTEVPVGQRFEIVHIEDEPDAIYRQLLAADLRPGMVAQVEARSADHVDLVTPDRRQVRLNTVQASNVAVSELADTLDVEEASLSELTRGHEAVVLGLSPSCRGAARRRLLDLGFVPGTLVGIELVSPVGDPTAYRVRGSVVALRRTQAGLIRIREVNKNAA